MTPRTGRPRKDPTAARVTLGAKVHPATVQAFKDAAAAAGMPLGHYLDALAPTLSKVTPTA